jgi:hypothetical protein
MAKTGMAALMLTAALLIPGAAAADENLAMREVGPPIKPLSEVYKAVTAQKDFGALRAARYDRAEREYQFTYRTPDGQTRVATYDAVTGQKR